MTLTVVKVNPQVYADNVMYTCTGSSESEIPTKHDVSYLPEAVRKTSCISVNNNIVICFIE